MGGGALSALTGSSRTSAGKTLPPSHPHPHLERDPYPSPRARQDARSCEPAERHPPRGDRAAARAVQAYEAALVSMSAALGGGGGAHGEGERLRGCRRRGRRGAEAAFSPLRRWVAQGDGREADTHWRPGAPTLSLSLTLSLTLHPHPDQGDGAEAEAEGLSDLECSSC